MTYITKKGDIRDKTCQKLSWESVIRFYLWGGGAMRHKLNLPSDVAAGSA